MSAAAGHSGTPLAKKLGIGAGARVAVIGAPASYAASLAPLPPDVVFAGAADADCALVHLFAVERAVLADALARWRVDLDPRTVVWVSWPKKASRVLPGAPLPLHPPPPRR